MEKEKTTCSSKKRKQEKGSAFKGDSHVAAGGELLYVAGGDHPALTTNQGVALSDNQNSLRANPRGPTHLAGALKILSKTVTSPLMKYWSGSPYWLGPPGTTGGRAVKYSLVPRFKGTAPPIDLKISPTTTWAMPGDGGMAFVNVVQSPAGTGGKVLWILAECGRD